MKPVDPLGMVQALGSQQDRIQWLGFFAGSRATCAKVQIATANLQFVFRRILQSIFVLRRTYPIFFALSVIIAKQKFLTQVFSKIGPLS